jgi:hypothetical protein
MEKEIEKEGKTIYKCYNVMTPTIYIGVWNKSVTLKYSGLLELHTKLKDHYI